MGGEDLESRERWSRWPAIGSISSGAHVWVVMGGVEVVEVRD